MISPTLLTPVLKKAKESGSKRTLTKSSCALLSKIAEIPLDASYVTMVSEVLLTRTYWVV